MKEFKEIDDAPEYTIGTDGMVYNGDKIVGIANNIQMKDALEEQKKQHEEDIKEIKKKIHTIYTNVNDKYIRFHETAILKCFDEKIKELSK